MAANYTTNPGETFVWACGTLRLIASLQGHSYDDLKRRCLLKNREHWIEDQAFSSSYDLASLPLPPSRPYRLDRRHTGRLRKRDNNLLPAGMGGGGRAKSWQPESMVLYNSFHTLCSRLWSTTTTMRTRIWTTTTGTSDSSSPRKRVEKILLIIVISRVVRIPCKSSNHVVKISLCFRSCTLDPSGLEPGPKLQNLSVQNLFFHR